MTSKEQARVALEAIAELVGDLGKDSRIGTALMEAQQAIVMLKDELTESEKDYQAAHEAAHIVAEQKDAEIAKYKARNQELLADSNHSARYIDELSTRAGDAQRRAEAAEAEVIKLKAKLYDLMIAQ